MEMFVWCFPQVAYRWLYLGISSFNGNTDDFISSLDASDPKRLGTIVRAHWGIENNLHWILDQAFDEDAHRTRTGHSAANMAVIRHIVLNLIKAEKTAKVGVKIKRLKAGWNNDYLLKILFGK
jgi:hypothetical protein